MQQVRRRRLANVSTETKDEDTHTSKRERTEGRSANLPLIHPETGTASSPMFTSPKGIDKTARALNLLLEQIFYVTVRTDANISPQQQQSLVYVESGDDLLTVSNLSEVLLNRLTSSQDPAGSAGYLVSSYRRLVLKEMSVQEKLKADLQKYVFARSMCLCVSFAWTHPYLPSL